MDSSPGAPTLTARVASIRRATNGSYTVRWTRIRERAQQSWPALSKTAEGADEAARSRSASSKTTLADLPPSSRVTRLICPAAPRITSTAHLGRAGERDLRHVRVLDEPLPDHGAGPDDDVDDPLGDPRLERELGQPQGRERRELGRLEHDGVPAGERRAELPARDIEREVPGHDQPDDAERLVEGGCDAARDGNRVPAVLVDRAGVVVEDLGDHADLAARADDRLADVLRLDAGELLGVLFDQPGERPEQPCPVLRRQVPPGGERRLCPGDGLVRLSFAGLRELRNRPLGRGIEDGERHPRSKSRSRS